MKTHTVGLGMWQETVRNIETRNTQCRTCIIARKRKKFQNETQTLCDLEYGQKQSKTWKMRNTHSRTWIMARKLKNVENETQILFDLVCDKKQGKTWQMKNAH